ncbi:DUF4274 domain-containing protein [Pontibacter sp. FD36]|uniref:DUF4274 domain-containing protein n=1 Tax=Pontibacter sp. FD36 TaxID=2789860 RepID=UPI0018A96324|nr:DUF4274 domain-containing protein [Pontibacter sp. FD36]MBF8963452.1 DUF4274 domain-containing protein [Pontibacter sp. FD36]
MLRLRLAIRYTRTLYAITNKNLMIILPNKERLIHENFIEFSFNNEDEDFLPDYKLFEKLNSTEQYYLAQNYNWDNNGEILKWIIESHKCDKGTASLIFWSAEPDSYFDKSEKEIAESEKDIFLLLKRIVEKFNNKEFRRSNLKYDPTEKVQNVDWSKQNVEWNIPEELKMPTTGFNIISLGIIQHKIWQWQRKRKEAKRAAKRLKRKK